MVNAVFELTKVTEGQEASEPDFFYIDKYNRIYYGHTKEPNFCDGEDFSGNIDHDETQLIWNGSSMFCPVCVTLEEVRELGFGDE